MSTKNEIHDYVFPGLHKILNRKKKKQVLFVPNFIVHNNILNIYKNIKILSKQKYIFLENWISFSEFFKYMLKHLFFNSLNVDQKKFKKFFSFNCSSLILSDFNSKIDFYSEFQSILKIKFIEKISKLNLKVNKTISRFENHQLIDLGFMDLEFFSTNKKFGFSGFFILSSIIKPIPHNF